MPSFPQAWLSEEEILFQRMESFHQLRVEAISAGQSPLGKRDDGYLVVHMIPRSCVQKRNRFEGANLKEHASKLSAFSDESYPVTASFNIDGLIYLYREQQPRSYSQLFRDGRLEAVMSDITFPVNSRGISPERESPRYLHDPRCEQAVFKLVKEYLLVCQGIGIHPSITIFSALVGCKGVRFYSRWGHNSLPGIDRSPAYLPEIVVDELDADPVKLMRPWCDILAQSMGLEKSANFDEAGIWKKQRS
jgi:hypothetical protein